MKIDLKSFMGDKYKEKVPPIESFVPQEVPKNDGTVKHHPTEGPIEKYPDEMVLKMRINECHLQRQRIFFLISESTSMLEVLMFILLLKSNFYYPFILSCEVIFIHFQRMFGTAVQGF